MNEGKEGKLKTYSKSLKAGKLLYFLITLKLIPSFHKLIKNLTQATYNFYDSISSTLKIQIFIMNIN